MENNLKEKRVLITGATNGIGKATAIKFAKEGANLILLGRNLEKLDSIAQEIKNNYEVRIETVLSDIRNYTLLKKEMDRVLKDNPVVDILVNNAGLALGLDKVYMNSVEDIDTVIDTNIKGVLYMLELVVPKMIQHNVEGTIINLGSVAGNSAYAGGAVYCASKAAVKIISDGLRIDLVDKPIRVTTILPGAVETDFSVVRFKGDQERAAGVYKGLNPLTPEDVAETIVHVSSLPQNIQLTDITLTPIQQADGRCIYKREE